MSREDREKAEQGLVELREGAESHYKHIEELTLGDRAGRLQAQKSRMAWVRERLEKKASVEASGNASTNPSNGPSSPPGSLTGEAVAGEEPAGATGEAWQ